MTAPRFLSEPEPPRGVATPVAPGIRRLVADNPGPMTYRGTNTYLLDGDAGVTVVDPGPDSAMHVAAILRQAGGPVTRMLVTHTHADHVGALPALAAATAAPVVSAANLTDGARTGDWTALHTPGHAPDHVCFARSDGVVLSGDHVMSFSSSVVIPPDGDMAAYMAGLRRLLGRQDTLYLPGHGPPITDPHGFTAALLTHRLAREAAILGLLRDGPARPPDLVASLYPGLDRKLHLAAEANVGAHLYKLANERLAVRHGEMWQAI